MSLALRVVAPPAAMVAMASRPRKAAVGPPLPPSVREVRAPPATVPLASRPAAVVPVSWAAVPAPQVRDWAGSAPRAARAVPAWVAAADRARITEQAATAVAEARTLHFPRQNA